MICPQCKAAGQTSQVRLTIKKAPKTGGRIDAFYDEQGVAHHHREDIVEHFTCSKGHDFSSTIKIPCSSCQKAAAPTAEPDAPAPTAPSEPAKS